MRTQAVAQRSAKAIASRPQRIELKDDLHAMPYSNAQRKHCVARVQPFNTADRAKWERHATASTIVTLTQEAQKRLCEGETASIYQIFRFGGARIDERE